VVSWLRLKTSADKVFEHLHMLWTGILLHPYTVITVKEGGAKLGKLG
jgi:hypothetical protein